ncbi:MAG: hypothetical protein K2G41_08965 [Duncaniella sp.]|uniref:hypothetical protein n=1 Tax=Duncaniella sp. TaxID=2518496 RepID=UPI0023C93534|nr:hypothetical protein [Duncaniella sp.]MDE6090819.1 hypothetical protein [Duncaniella sp.]
MKKFLNAFLAFQIVFFVAAILLWFNNELKTSALILDVVAVAVFFGYYLVSVKELRKRS